MEYEIIELIIPMDDPTPRFLLIWEVPCVPRDEFIVKGYFTDGFACVDVGCRGLSFGDAREGFDLSGEVWSGGTEGGETNRGGVDGR
jgi:hypothetical protein